MQFTLAKDLSVHLLWLSSFSGGGTTTKQNGCAAKESWSVSALPRLEGLVWVCCSRGEPAFERRDRALCGLVIADDDEIDALPALKQDTRIMQRITYLLWIAHKLERIADHCGNVCERIVFIVEGDGVIASLDEGREFLAFVYMTSAIKAILAAEAPPGAHT